MSDPGRSVDGCDLCQAARITPWFHEDEICWIAECTICATPMVVWRSHGTAPPEVPEPALALAALMSLAPFLSKKAPCMPRSLWMLQ